MAAPYARCSLSGSPAPARAGPAVRTRLSHGCNDLWMCSISSSVNSCPPRAGPGDGARRQSDDRADPMSRIQPVAAASGSDAERGRATRAATQAPVRYGSGPQAQRQIAQTVELGGVNLLPLVRIGIHHDQRRDVKDVRRRRNLPGADNDSSEARDLVPAPWTINQPDRTYPF